MLFFHDSLSDPSTAEDPTLIARALLYFARHDAQRGNSHSRQWCLQKITTSRVVGSANAMLASRALRRQISPHKIKVPRIVRYAIGRL